MSTEKLSSKDFFAVSRFNLNGMSTVHEKQREKPQRRDVFVWLF